MTPDDILDLIGLETLAWVFMYCGWLVALALALAHLLRQRRRDLEGEDYDG